MWSPSGRMAFREFLRCEYSEENILFWLACEELKKETNHEAIEEKARFIYEDYISILSPKEVGISFNPRRLQGDRAALQTGSHGCLLRWEWPSGLLAGAILPPKRYQGRDCEV